MTVVNPKSISGITSITTASGSDNLLTIHTSDANNTERLRIDSTGATKIVTGIVTTLTATTGIVTTLTANTVTSLGAVSGTTGTFSGAVSGTTGTFSGAVSGTTGTFTGDVDIADTIVHTGDTNTKIRFPAADTVSIETGGSEALRVDSSKRLLIGHTSSQQSTSMLQVSRTNNSTIRVANSDATVTNYAALDLAPANSIAGARIAAVAEGTFGSTGAETAYLKFDTRNAGTTSEKLRIASGGDVTVQTGNLVIGTSGKGIDFSATGDGSSVTTEVFDDYEEGTYTPVLSGGGTTYTYGGVNDYTLRSPNSTTDTSTISYVKIGSMVYLNFAIFWNSTITARYAITIPFTAKGSAYALCITPASFQVDIDGDMLGTLGLGNNSTGFDTYRITKDTGTGGHSNVPLSASSEVYYQICYQAL